VTRFADDRVCVLQGTTWAGVSGVRVKADELADLLAETRRLIPAEKVTAWWLDPDARPADIYERLTALGLTEPRDRGSLLHALACVAAPPPAPPEITVRRVETFADHLAALELQWDAFAVPASRRDAQRAHVEHEFESARRAGVPVTFLATLDGRPAGTGRSVPAESGVFLIAGAVAPWARGRGVYRALVRARWDDAVARGTPALVTEALPDTSYPILKRLGFEDVCVIRRLEDLR